MIDFALFALFASLFAVLFAGYSAWSVMKKEEGTPKMREISGAIREGAMAYLNRQNKTLALFAVIIAALLWSVFSVTTAITFVIGAVFSALAGYTGMMISVRANVRTANAAFKEGLKEALNTSFQGGTVTGMAVVGLGLLGVTVLYLYYGDPLVLVGFGFGASLISLFARVGGGIYTKGADVGADLVGKVEAGIPEDDPRNAAVIADNVGDNVGDCAGMAADLFQSYAITLLAAMLLGATAIWGTNGVMLPLAIGGVAIIASIIATFVVSTDNPKKIWSVLNRSILATAAIAAVGFYLITNFMFEGDLAFFYAGLVGLLLTVFIGMVTEYYTAAGRKPTKNIAESAKTGAGTNVILGIAYGMESTFLIAIAICVAIFASFYFGATYQGMDEALLVVGGVGYGQGVYGIAIAAMAMISMTGIMASVDSYGPITDNAGGIAEMSGMPKKVREITDALDAVGNTSKAVTKGFAIGSAALAALSLFLAFAQETNLMSISIMKAPVVIGLFVGGMLPFVFSSLTMRAVGKAARLVVKEVRRQFKEIKGLMQGKTKPDYARCVDICAKAAIKELFLPGSLAVFVPVIAGFVLGAEALGGLLAGAIITGLMLAITMTTGGAAWDNAKKYIEAGNFGGKGSDAHKAAVVGDTVGDAFKDTSGPALNPLIKVLNMIALLIAPLLML